MLRASPTIPGRGPLVVLVLFAVVLFAFTKSEPVSWSDASRMGSIQALVEHGTLALDSTDFLFQGDKVRIGGPLSRGGHYYSHQPPMLAILGSIPYRALHALGRGISDPGTYKIITLCVVGLPVLLGLVCLGQLMAFAGASSRQITWLLAAAGFGTLLLPYALVLNQHAPAAGLVMAGLLQVQRLRFGGAGALFSLAATVDLTAVFFALAVLLPVYRAGGVRGVLVYAGAAIPAVALHLGVNYAIAGDLLPLGLHAEAFEYPGSPFVLMDLTGGAHDMLTPSGPAYVFDALFGASGLFSHHPVLLFALAAGALVLIEQHRIDRPAASDPSPPAGNALAASIDHAVLLASAGICVFYLTQSRNFGGSSFGMRWFCVFAPSLMLLPAAWLGRDSDRKISTAIFAPLLIWSVVATSIGAIQPWIKATYRWQNTDYGEFALIRGNSVSLLTHARYQLDRLTTAHEPFEEQRWERDVARLMTAHMDGYLERQNGRSEEAHREAMAAGLSKLDRLVQLFDEEETVSSLRVLAHYQRAVFCERLGLEEEARRELRIVRRLSPNFLESLRRVLKERD
jgi:hypothetical protein